MKLNSIGLSLLYTHLASGAVIQQRDASSNPQLVPLPHKLFPPTEMYQNDTAASHHQVETTNFAAANSGRGIAWSPYTKAGPCKTQTQVNAEFKEMFANEDFASFRTYGVDCNQARLAINGIKANGKAGSAKVWLGIYNVDQADAEAVQLADQVNNEWDLIDSVSVGNEGFNDGKYTIPTVAAAVTNVKKYLAGRGWHGRVTTVDVFFQYRDHPALCDVGDAVAVNIQPYFDGAVLPANVGTWVRGQMNNVKTWCPGKTVVVTEAGWPSCGKQNGKSIASPQNQATAVASLRKEFSGYLFLFTAFNDLWKQPGDLGVEQCFGIVN